MKTLLALLFALAFCHFAMANQEPTPTSAKGVITRIIKGITGGFQPSPHIVGGIEAKPHSYPYQVALFITLEGGADSFCGGSLISPQWVLTAMHCIDKADDIYAILGAHNFTTFEANRQLIHVDKIVQHANWIPKKSVNDIALLKLRSKATLDENVQTIRLPSLANRNKLLHQTSVVMTGWGMVSESRINEFSPVLKSAESIVMPERLCNLLFSGSIRNGMICVDGSKRAGVCNGDSGGPLVMTEADGQRTLIGVTSFGATYGCESGYPYVFTRVDQYLGWIANNIGIRLRAD